MILDTPLAVGVITGAFRLSELARDEAEVLKVATPSAVMGGPDQLRGTEHLHDRSVGQEIMFSPQRDNGVTQAGGTTGGSDSQGLTASAQTIIAWNRVFLQVEAFVKQKLTQLRSGVFLIKQLDRDIDENAMGIIELKLMHSRALGKRPGPWRETWDVEYFLKALEEIYAVSEVDKFSDASVVWRALMTTLQSSV